MIADTKFELGVIDGELAICDEILTPDSSRFWAVTEWSPGAAPASFDKQPVRDWVESTGWDKESPPPAMPAAVVAATRERYVQAYERISGRSFADWWGVGNAERVNFSVARRGARSRGDRRSRRADDRACAAGARLCRRGVGARRAR